MTKAIICVSSTAVDENTPRISYTVSVIGPPHYSYGSDYIVNTSITVNANLLAWRNKVIAQAAERGVVLLTSDIIVFGAPS